MEAAQLKQRFEAAGQGHVFASWDRLSEQERAALLNDALSVPVEELKSLYGSASNRRERERGFVGFFFCTPFTWDDADKLTESKDAIAPWKDVHRLDASTRAQHWASGLEQIRLGRVAALLMAGGQGTRLGSDQPKGMYNVGLQSAKTLFQLQAERLLRLRELAGGPAVPPIPWLIMTSEATDASTEAFFNQHNFFGLERSSVRFFEQGLYPSILGILPPTLRAADGSCSCREWHYCHEVLTPHRAVAQR